LIGRVERVPVGWIQYSAQRERSEGNWNKGRWRLCWNFEMPIKKEAIVVSMISDQAEQRYKGGRRNEDIWILRRCSVMMCILDIENQMTAQIMSWISLLYWCLLVCTHIQGDTHTHTHTYTHTHTHTHAV